MRNEAELKEFFSHSNWVVVGDVLNSKKYANRIYERLKSRGYLVFAVNPRDTTGTIYKSLSEVKDSIDAIDLCINPIQGIEIIKEANRLGIKRVLIQPGAVSDEILEFCRNSGIIAVEGCALVYFSSMVQI